MDSFEWQVLSEIFLGIGIVLFIAALFLTIRYRVISNLISDMKERKLSPGPVRAQGSFTRDMIDAEEELSSEADADAEGPWTVVVAPKKEESSDGTVVVRKKDDEEQFIVTSNIVVINADVDVIDNGRRK
ncbi:hypothetical protein [Ruminococcus flavefaciens]|uniref:hypothetical protein n=1 Tax=Ruminococcus flavefaciens TaxID=1265 RepID=UPI0026E9B5DF|nr:hypothetical protein [Ruminococcus flavefaciens]